MEKPDHVWVVRAGDDNELAAQVEKKGAVAIGWEALGDITNLRSREEYKVRYQQAYPTHSKSRTNVNNGQLYRFAVEMAPGDYVLTYDKSVRELILGRIVGPLEYNARMFAANYPYIHHVDWLKRIPRDNLSVAARNSLGSSLTVFRVDDHLDEIHRQATSDSPDFEAVIVPEAEPEESVPFHDEVKSRADELIADLVSQLDPYDFQDLVAGMLRAMGFRAVSSQPGRDRGVDIIAHPDPLGFGKPRIKVQVKHRNSPVSGPDMRNFVATLRAEESGLFVSTGGFTPDARMESEKAREPITLVDRDKFIELLLEHYEDLEAEFQARIPLRKIWVPAG